MPTLPHVPLPPPERPCASWGLQRPLLRPLTDAIVRANDLGPIVGGEPDLNCRWRGNVLHYKNRNMCNVKVFPIRILILQSLYIKLFTFYHNVRRTMVLSL